LPLHVLQSRTEQGRKLRAMYRSLGLSRADCAKFLHVTERCLHNWEAGRHTIPYAAYRLLRIHCRMELPGACWRGWSISRGKLCTPEGHELDPRDAAWWSLLVRRAEIGSQALRQLHALKRGQRAGAGADSARSALADLAPASLPGAAGDAAAPAAAGLVLSRTSRPEFASKMIARYMFNGSLLQNKE